MHSLDTEKRNSKMIITLLFLDSGSQTSAILLPKKQRIFGQENCLNFHTIVGVTVNLLEKLKRFLRGSISQTQNYHESISLYFMQNENTKRLHGFALRNAG